MERMRAIAALAQFFSTFPNISQFHRYDLAFPEVHHGYGKTSGI
jgi:hypothetical protein